MRYLKYLALLALLALPVAYAQAQVSIGVQIGPSYGLYNAPPVCAYGFYSYYPFTCAPYGYWGPDYFVDGVFIGVGPWDRFYFTHPVYYRPFFFNRGFGFHDGFRRFHDGDDFRGGFRRFHDDDRFRRTSFRSFHDNGRFRGEDHGFRADNDSHFRGNDFHGNGFRGNDGFRSFNGGGRGFSEGRYSGGNRSMGNGGGKSYGGHSYGGGSYGGRSMSGGYNSGGRSYGAGGSHTSSSHGGGGSNGGHGRR